MRQQLTAIAAMTLVVGAGGVLGRRRRPSLPRPRCRPRAIAELTDDPAATTAVSEAIDALREGNSGTFTTHVEYADLSFDYYGSYRLQPPSSGCR